VKFQEAISKEKTQEEFREVIILIPNRKDSSTEQPQTSSDFKYELLEEIINKDDAYTKSMIGK